MRGKPSIVIYLGLVLVGLLILSGAGIAQEQKEAVVAQEQQEVRLDEVRSIKAVTGRLDSVRKEKVVITYEPEDQQGVQLQTYYLRDEDTSFANQGEKKLKAGDIVEITYRQSKWTNAEGKKRVERIAQEVRFIRSRATEELRKEAQGDLGTETERLSGNSGEVDDEM